jgi:hypothetical protein
MDEDADEREHGPALTGARRGNGYPLAYLRNGTHLVVVKPAAEGNEVAGGTALGRPR